MWVDVAILVFILIVIIVFSSQLGKLRRELQLLKKERQGRREGEEQRLLRLYQSLEEAMEVFEQYAEATKDELKRERESLLELSRRPEGPAAATPREALRQAEPEQPWGAAAAGKPPEAETRTERTRQVMELLSKGKSIGEAARILGLSKAEVELIAGMRR